MWHKCRSRNGINCMTVYNNSVCNPECNVADCLYDGYDCSVRKPCNPSYNDYCEDFYNNGVCNQGCNNSACNWDGQDCANTPASSLVPGTMIVMTVMSREKFLNNSARFLRNLGQLLQVVVIIKRDENNMPMVYPWRRNTDGRKRRSVSSAWERLRRKRSVPTDDQNSVLYG